MLTSGDVNHAITCTVVASNANGSSLPAISLPDIPVALPLLSIPLMTSLPAITVSRPASARRLSETAYSVTLRAPARYSAS